MEKWQNYFLATAGASATLIGLIFVGVSINLQKILSLKPLPGRALGTIILLINILLVSSFSLIPEQPQFYLGLEIFFLALVVWMFTTRLDVVTLRGKNNPYWRQNLQNFVFTQLAVLPFMLSGIYLINANQRGLYWLVPGIAMSYLKAIIDAWVLLIEINR